MREFAIFFGLAPIALRTDQRSDLSLLKQKTTQCRAPFRPSQTPHARWDNQH